MTRAPVITPPPIEIVPPLSSATVFRLLTVGAGLCGLAGLIGFIAPVGPSLVSTLRLLLVAVGLLVMAVGWIERPADWRVWAVAGLTTWFGVGGLPAHWDSARLVAGVLGTFALAGAALVAAPPVWRGVGLTAVMAFHFGGLLTATTAPDTTTYGNPWVTAQAMERVYKPFWKFFYLGNAYHFYSPDPGPASHLFFLIQYQTDEDDVDEKTGQVKLDKDGQPLKRKSAEWVDMPHRQTQYRDPLGMTYYRRLSLTELVSYSIPGSALPKTPELMAVVQRRRENLVGLKGVPVPGSLLLGGEIDLNQYRVPVPHLRRYMIPSYARHIAAEYTGPRKAADGRTVNYTVSAVKMFRVEHRVINPHQFLSYPDPATVEAKRLNKNLNANPPTVGGASPYHPTLYAPYYLGEYDPTGTLVNPADPLLYWLIPIDPLPNRPKDQADFKDYMSEYVGHAFDWRGKE